MTQTTNQTIRPYAPISYKKYFAFQHFRNFSTVIWSSIVLISQDLPHIYTKIFHQSWQNSFKYIMSIYSLPISKQTCAHDNGSDDMSWNSGTW